MNHGKDDSNRVISSHHTGSLQLKNVFEGADNLIPDVRETRVQIPRETSAYGLLVVRVFGDGASHRVFSLISYQVPRSYRCTRREVRP
jgi:hypothetical protein